MTRGSNHEYLRTIRGAYHRANRQGKTALFTQAVQITGYHRKHVLRHLRASPTPSQRPRRARRRQASPEVIDALRLVWNAADRICAKRLQPFLPESDSTFINDILYRYRVKEHITFTRSRPYRKNDQAHVEQKNWSVIRRLVSYDRYGVPAAAEALNTLYGSLRLYTNFFQPSMKLVHKTHRGAKVSKLYDRAQTPYQRLRTS